MDSSKNKNILIFFSILSLLICIISAGVLVLFTTNNRFSWKRAANQVRQLKEKAIAEGVEGESYAMILNYARDGFEFRRMKAVVAIGKLGAIEFKKKDKAIVSREAAQLLEILLDDIDPYVRRETANSLHRIGPKAFDAVDGLIQATYDKYGPGNVSTDAAVLSASALGHFSGPKVEKALEDAS